MTTSHALEDIQGRLFLTIPEVATILRVDQRTARRAVENGDVPAVRIGNRWRIPTAVFLERCGLERTEFDGAPTGGDHALALVEPSHPPPYDDHPAA